MTSKAIERVQVLSRDLTTGNIMIFDSIYKAAKHFGLVYVTLTAHLKSKNKGLGIKDNNVFKYYDDEEWAIVTEDNTFELGKGGCNPRKTRQIYVSDGKTRTLFNSIAQAAKHTNVDYVNLYRNLITNNRLEIKEKGYTFFLKKSKEKTC